MLGPVESLTAAFPYGSFSIHVDDVSVGAEGDSEEEAADNLQLAAAHLAFSFEVELALELLIERWARCSQGP